MSDGKTHATASILLAGTFALSSLTGDLTRLQYASGAILGILLTPDLDLMEAGGNITNSIVGKAGGVVQKVWKAFWFPYAGLSHRSFASHFPVVSTYGRLFYILIYFQIGCLIADHFGYPFETNYVWWVKNIVYSPVVIGLLCSDILHYFMDLIWSQWKGLRG